MWDAPLQPEEVRWVERAVLKRRREFAAGRHCARAALARLGVPACSIPSGPDRLPRWPEGFVGSIAHGGGTCLVGVAPRRLARSLGLDVERADAVDSSLTPLVCGARELECARAASGFETQRTVALLFSAKEAVYKCCYPLTRALELRRRGDPARRGGAKLHRPSRAAPAPGAESTRRTIRHGRGPRRHRGDTVRFRLSAAVRPGRAGARAPFSAPAPSFQQGR